jgi:hypothetical protein
VDVLAIVVKAVMIVTNHARMPMLNATDVINQARYSEVFIVRVRVGTFSLKMPAPWTIQVDKHGILTAQIPALTLAEARHKAREVIESTEWEYV